MRATLTVNGRHAVTTVATGFNPEKFSGIRFDVLRAASYWNGVVREAKRDFDLVAGLVKKYQGLVKDFTGEVKSLALDLSMCWEPAQEAEDTQHPSRIMMISIAENFEAVLNDHINNFNIGNNAVLLDQMYEGGAFRSINLSIELTSDEEEEFGISKWKLIAFRFKTGVHITKTRNGNDYVYGLNLDMLCPALNFSALLYGHPEILRIFAPIAACYAKEVEEAVGFFLKSWDSVRNPVKELPASEAE
jgi:hypothetical protein